MQRLTPQSYGGVRVPYSAAWSEEIEQREPRVVRWKCEGRMLPFLSDGPNWPGRGKPLFKHLHADRCRELLRHDACQMCCQPFGAIGDGPRIMVSGRTLHGAPLVTDGLPMHPACAVEAYDACPGLQRQVGEGRMRFFSAPRWGFECVPKLLGIVSPDLPEADERTNELIRRHGTIFAGPDLVLSVFRRMSLEDLRAMARDTAPKET